MNLSAIVKPCQLKIYQQGHIYCQYDEIKMTEFSEQMFNAQFWQHKKAITGTAQGRGTTWFIEYNTQQWVLRHYYRGGLIGKCIKDSYLYLGLKRTRAALEFSLLTKMQHYDLPAPHPVAYRVIKNGLFYHADLISQRIENSTDLVTILSEKPLTSSQWRNIGTTIKKFHQQGIYHHDLNAHNILIDNNNKVWLIDFDRGEQRKVATSWQQNNLERLKRSFLKELNKLTIFHWQGHDWHDFMQGYQSEI